jgi:hypothetical protein
MSKKQKFILLGVIGFIFLLIWIAFLALVVKNLRGLNQENNEPPVADVTLCDENASGLCVVNFGANKLNRMVINLQLPDAAFPTFYIKAANRENVSVYSCEIAESVPASAYCTGVRTPLGETINIEVYTTDGDTLVARGTFLVSAIALSTPISQPTEAPTEEEIPTSIPEGEFIPTPESVSPSP